VHPITIHHPRENTMTQTSQVQPHATEQLPADLVELEIALHELPASQSAHVLEIFDRVKQSTLRRRRILNLVQDALSQLRLDMKYLMFDLEATRRERDVYRRQVE
jgi:hypothetical protein